VVMDNEAGMEHISRLVARSADILLIVSDPTQRGIMAAKRIHDLARELKLDIKKDYLIINRVDGELPAEVKEAADSAGLNIAGCVPEDELVSRYDTEGRPTAELPDDAKSVKALNDIFKTVILIED
jgi:CO dehydrogenase maturation factor